MSLRSELAAAGRVRFRREEARQLVRLRSESEVRPCAPCSSKRRTSRPNQRRGGRERQECGYSQGEGTTGIRKESVFKWIEGAMDVVAAWQDREVQPEERKGTLRRDRLERLLWLTPQGGKGKREERAERLNGVAGMARRLMDEHGLTGWTLAAGHNSLRPDMPRAPADDGSPSPSAQPLGCTGGIAPSHAEPTPSGPASRHAG